MNYNTDAVVGEYTQDMTTTLRNMLVESGHVITHIGSSYPSRDYMLVDNKFIIFMPSREVVDSVMEVASYNGKHDTRIELESPNEVLEILNDDLIEYFKIVEMIIKASDFRAYLYSFLDAASETQFSSECSKLVKLFNDITVKADTAFNNAQDIHSSIRSKHKVIVVEHYKQD